MMALPILSALQGEYRSFEDVFKARDLSSTDMQQARRRWRRLYYEDMPKRDYDPRQRLAYTVVHKLEKALFSEYTAGYHGEGAKAEGLRQALAAMDEVRQKGMQAAMMVGEAMLKPVPGQDGFTFLVLPRDCYAVLEQDEKGRPTSVCTEEKTVAGRGRDRRFYTLLERRTVGGDGRVTVESQLFCAVTPESLGRRVPLGTLGKYKALRDSVTLPVPLHSTGLVPLVMPMENCVDGSPAGVSVYAAAAGLIEKANGLEAQFNREFENARSRVIASSDLLRQQEGVPALADELFVGLNDDPTAVGLQIFNPAIRDESFMNRKNANLRDIENTIDVKRGILSEVEAAERTATEITSSEGGYNLTVIALQAVWTRAVHEALRVCDGFGRMYYGWDESEIEQPVLDYGDGVLFNRDKVWQEYERMAQYGWLKPEVALAWYFGADIQNDEAVQEIRERYMPGVNDGDT